MAYELVSSAEAEDDFKNIVLYLKETWSVQSSNNFIARTNKRLEKLAEIPAVARPTSRQSIYMYKLDRKSVIFLL